MFEHLATNDGTTNYRSIKETSRHGPDPLPSLDLGRQAPAVLPLSVRARTAPVTARTALITPPVHPLSVKARSAPVTARTALIKPSLPSHKPVTA